MRLSASRVRPSAFRETFISFRETRLFSFILLVRPSAFRETLLLFVRPCGACAFFAFFLLYYIFLRFFVKYFLFFRFFPFCSTFFIIRWVFLGPAAEPRAEMAREPGVGQGLAPYLFCSPRLLGFSRPVKVVFLALFAGSLTKRRERVSRKAEGLTKKQIEAFHTKSKGSRQKQRVSRKDKGLAKRKKSREKAEGLTKRKGSREQKEV